MFLFDFPIFSLLNLLVTLTVESSVGCDLKIRSSFFLTKTLGRCLIRLLAWKSKRVLSFTYQTNSKVLAWSESGFWEFALFGDLSSNFILEEESGDITGSYTTYSRQSHYYQF